MPYKNKNMLLRMIEIQNLVLEQKRHGVTQRFVYETKVDPHYHISYSTFNRYLSYPAKQELKRQQQKEKNESASIGE